ncbi:MAG TPA: HEPN domain-containing protein, partial [Patescibacteria group bacterium]|nr:HEPN domain-containing protein [Patescibacteria group bacterium]
GGNFYNDWYGKNRYTQLDNATIKAEERGLFLLYQFVTDRIRYLKHSIPEDTQFVNLPNLEELGDLGKILLNNDPKRVLFNALLPFAVAALEHFFSRSFVILMYSPRGQRKLSEKQGKIDFADAFALSKGEKTLESIIADTYSFQNINSIHKAFSEWHEIDFWAILRTKKHKRKTIDKKLEELIEGRHGIVHRFEFDFEMNKKKCDEVFDFILTVIEAFVDYLENESDLKIREF